jgi:hypothetical protein
VRKVSRADLANGCTLNFGAGELAGSRCIAAASIALSPRQRLTAHSLLGRPGEGCLGVGLVFCFHQLQQKNTSVAYQLLQLEGFGRGHPLTS